MMRSLFLLFLSFTLTGIVCAQGHDAFVRRLSEPDSVHRTRVDVVLRGDARDALAALSRIPLAQKIRGYRVRIFLDNAQSARAQASEALSRFQTEFPGTPVYITYENPYWKVSAGNCITSEEAITLWGRVKSSFDRAFVVREEIPILTISE